MPRLFFNKLILLLAIGGFFIAGQALAHQGYFPVTMINSGTPENPNIATSTDLTKFYYTNSGAGLVGWMNLASVVATSTPSHYWIWPGGGPDAYAYAGCSNISALSRVYGDSKALQVNNSGGNCSVLGVVQVFSDTHTHSIQVVKTGQGQVDFSPLGVSCGTDCQSYSYTYNTSATATLTAAPDTAAGYAFAGWGGVGCGGLSTSCFLGFNANAFNRLITASFQETAANKFVLTVRKSGFGDNGVVAAYKSTVTNSPFSGSGVGLEFNCGSDCSEAYTAGTTVTLYAHPDPESVAYGTIWSGCDSVSVLDKSCTVRVSANKTVTATFALVTYNLNVVKSGSGSGTVSSKFIDKISCGTTCSTATVIGRGIFLTATPNPGSKFIGWSGCDVELGASCVVNMTSNKTVNAIFELIPLTLNVGIVGGSGGVTSDPAGINCSAGNNCSATFDAGANVTLTAGSGNTFLGWGGDCAFAGTNPTCALTMNADKNVTAAFAYKLTVVVAGSGNGYVQEYSPLPAINCGIGSYAATKTDCSQEYNSAITVTLAAVGEGGPSPTVLLGWEGCDSNPTVSQCAFTMNSDKTITANFGPPPRTLTVTAYPSVFELGSGSGTITSSPVGINCALNGTTASGDCTEVYPNKTLVTLIAANGPNSKINWVSPGCGIAPTCTVLLSGDYTSVATFGAYYELTVGTAGTGIGKVTSQPTGLINCGSYPALGSDCSEGKFKDSWTVTLNAEPLSGSIFTGWEGACGGVGSCVVNVNSAKLVTARFEFPNPTLLNVGRLGNQDITIIGSDSLLNCVITAATTTGKCARYYGDQTTLTISASFDAAQTKLDDWSGCDSIDTSVSPPRCVVNFSCPLSATAAGPALTDDGSVWAQATAAAQWSKRQGHASVVFNNKMWILGGYDPTLSDFFYFNDIWSSPDGVNWSRSAAAAPWPERELHTALVFKNKMWVIGGTNSYANFVWSSSDGKDWQLVAAEAPWPIAGKWGHASVVFDPNDGNGPRMWIIGGVTDYRNGTPSQPTNDVWYSYDGVTWVQATNSAPWAPRFLHSAVVFNNEIWVIGGLDDSGVGGKFYDSSRRFGVWHSPDGVNWTKVNSASATFWRRAAHASVVFDNKIWVIGGIGSLGSAVNDVWSSPDGITWTQETLSAAWPGRMYHTALVFDNGTGNKMWVLGGALYNGGPASNDVWYSVAHQ